MSCPDWSLLVAARAADALVDPPGFAAAREHLTGCADCRRTALAADPLLLFVPLANRSAAPAARDVEMQDSVLALVRASRIAAPAERSRSRRLARAARFAAGIALASLLALLGAPPVSAPAGSSGSANAGVATEADLEDRQESGEIARWIDETAVLAQPAVEELDRPEARVYDLSQADLAVVMIVDASLDV